jgi:hypothetical protein
MGEIIRKVMTKIDLPYNTAGDLRPAGDWGNYSKSYDENRSAILNSVGDRRPAGDWGNYSKSYDENRSAIQYCW